LIRARSFRVGGRIGVRIDDAGRCVYIGSGALASGLVPGDFTLSQVGHASLGTTSRYTHFTDEFRRETVERLASCTQVA
jgi:hypothetical protein